MSNYVTICDVFFLLLPVLRRGQRRSATQVVSAMPKCCTNVFCAASLYSLVSGGKKYFTAFIYNVLL
jgi:hypothetical protein